MLQNRQANIPILLLSICFVMVILYTVLRVSQEEFYLLFGLVTLAFASLFGLYNLCHSTQYLNWLVCLAIILRVCLIWVDPGLSDDIYRFIWDGMLWHDGINPFADTPTQILEIHNLSQEYLEIYPLLNSKDYYTIYPPVCQFMFWLSTFEWLPSWVAGAPLIKIIFVTSEVFSIWLIISLLKLFNLPARNVLLYAFNPLIILEFCGNLHFEAIMICFLLVMIYFLKNERFELAGLGFGLAVATKLIPLMFGPFLLLYLGIKKGIRFFVPAGLLVLCSFVVMLQEHFGSLLTSTNLYFKTFEFNASIYYLLRWIVSGVVGYNPIAFVGPLLSLLGLTYILLVSWEGRGDSKLSQFHLQILLVIFTLYLVFATTIHPWYVSTLIALSIFTRLRFPIVWSYVIFLSYSAYVSQPVIENYFLIAIEYLIVAGMVYFDYRKGNFQELFANKS